MTRYAIAILALTLAACEPPTFSHVRCWRDGAVVLDETLNDSGYYVKANEVRVLRRNGFDTIRVDRCEARQLRDGSGGE